MRESRHKNWQDDIESILLADELAERHDEVLQTLYLMLEYFEEQGFDGHAEFVGDKFIGPMEQYKYHRVLVNVRNFNRRYNQFQTYTLLFVETVRRLARYRMDLEKSLILSLR